MIGYQNDPVAFSRHDDLAFYKKRVKINVFRYQQSRKRVLEEVVIASWKLSSILRHFAQVVNRSCRVSFTNHRIPSLFGDKGIMRIKVT